MEEEFYDEEFYDDDYISIILHNLRVDLEKLKAMQNSKFSTFLEDKIRDMEEEIRHYENFKTGTKAISSKSISSKPLGESENYIDDGYFDEGFLEDL